MTTVLVRILMLLAVLLIPGAGAVAVIVAIVKKLRRSYAGLWLSMWWDKRVSRHRKEHLLDLRTSDYSYGALSGSELVLYAAFSALVRWVQTDGLYVLEQIDVADDPTEDFYKHPIAYKIRALYWWWLDARPRRIAEIAELSAAARVEAVGNQELDDQRMLRLLFEIRFDML